MRGWIDALQVLLSKASKWFQSDFKDLFYSLIIRGFGTWLRD